MYKNTLQYIYMKDYEANQIHPSLNFNLQTAVHLFNKTIGNLCLLECLTKFSD